MEHPAPEVRAREMETAEMPTTTRRIFLKAKESGWACLVTYARGTTLTREGGPGVVQESVLLRMREAVGPTRAAGEWVNGKFHRGWLWGSVPSVVTIGARQLASLPSREV
jgi:hypothetical protein